MLWLDVTVVVLTLVVTNRNLDLCPLLAQFFAKKILRYLKRRYNDTCAFFAIFLEKLLEDHCTVVPSLNFHETTSGLFLALEGIFFAFAQAFYCLIDVLSWICPWLCFSCIILA